MNIKNINREIKDLEFEIEQIDSEINKARESKNTGIVLMIVSIFFLWPLLIVGGIMYSNANNKEKELTSKKSRINHEIYRLYRIEEDLNE